jgi:predicted aspartyl protease
VVREFPVFGRKVVGILGIDLLGRASVVSLGLSEPRRLVLSSTRLPSSAEGVAVPFSVAAKHLFVEGSVEGVPVRLLFDTGARRTLIGRDVADKAGLRLDHDQVWKIRGLDDNRLELPSALAAKLAIGAVELREQRVYVGELPALRAMGLQNTGGLLGTDVLGQFERVEVDFTAGVIRFSPRGRDVLSYEPES